MQLGVLLCVIAAAANGVSLVISLRYRSVGIAMLNAFVLCAALFVAWSS